MFPKNVTKFTGFVWKGKGLAGFRRKIRPGILLFELRSGQAGNFFELIGKMREAAVMHFMSNFRQRHTLIKQQFLNPFDLVADIESFDRDVLRIREQVGHIGIVQMQIFGQVGRQVVYQRFVAMVDDLHDDVLYPLHQDILFVFE